MKQNSQKFEVDIKFVVKVNQQYLPVENKTEEI